jgi:phosphate-selective porin OprO/OprP
MRPERPISCLAWNAGFLSLCCCGLLVDARAAEISEAAISPADLGEIAIQAHDPLDGAGVPSRPGVAGTIAQPDTIVDLGEAPDLPESQRAKQSDIAKPPTLEEKLENWGRIYKNDDHPVLQELWLLGRYHGQQHWSEGNEGRDIDWENRRYRMGGQAKLYDKLTLHAQMVSGSDFEPFYNGFTELWSQWAFRDECMLTIGQQKHRFTHDRNVSSRYINTLERSLLLNMFNADYTPAITLSGRLEELSYYTGIFSNRTERNMWDAFTELNSGYSLLAAAYYDLGDHFASDTAHWGGSYVFSDANDEATNLNVFEQGISSALILTQGATSLVSEGLIGIGSEQGDAYGLNIQPGYFLTEKLQLATRYQFAASEGDQGLIAQRRYERPSGLTTGDRYHAAYLGLNHYLAGHRIKLMNGLEYSDLSGQNLWTASFAVRIFWGPHSKGPFPMAQTLKPN